MSSGLEDQKISDEELLTILASVERVAPAELTEAWCMSLLLSMPRARYLAFVQQTDHERSRRGV